MNAGNKGKIVKIPIDPALVAKELREAEADHAAAKAIASGPAGEMGDHTGILLTLPLSRGHRCLAKATVRRVTAA